MKSLFEKLANKINNMPDGNTFMASDFLDIAKKTTVNRMLLRLAEKKKIRSIGYGIYEKPVYSKLLREFADTNCMSVANTLANNYSWIIVPSGNTALNMLHMSTQVPYKLEYISSGPYRMYKFGKKTLKFSRCANKNIENMHYQTLLLIQAIKAIGKKKINKDDMISFKNCFTKKEIEMAIKETKKSTYWIHEIIKSISEA